MNMGPSGRIRFWLKIVGVEGLGGNGRVLMKPGLPGFSARIILPPSPAGDPLDERVEIPTPCNDVGVVHTSPDDGPPPVEPVEPLPPFVTSSQTMIAPPIPAIRISTIEPHKLKARLSPRSMSAKRTRSSANCTSVVVFHAGCKPSNAQPAGTTIGSINRTTSKPFCAHV